MLGLSGELMVHSVAGEESLRQWLAANEVIVIDIKYSISPQDQDCYLIIYK